mgnify:CR=1 FL=1
MIQIWCCWVDVLFFLDSCGVAAETAAGEESAVSLADELFDERRTDTRHYGAREFVPHMTRYDASGSGLSRLRMTSLASPTRRCYFAAFVR